MKKRIAFVQIGNKGFDTWYFKIYRWFLNLRGITIDWYYFAEEDFDLNFELENIRPFVDKIIVRG